MTNLLIVYLARNHNTAPEEKAELWYSKCTEWLSLWQDTHLELVDNWKQHRRHEIDVVYAITHDKT